jgi:predicted TIM-barrel fold metal-dependent hydrolase
MMIDSHQHVFWHGRADTDLVADMDEHGIDQAWLLTWEIPVGQELPGSYHGVLNPVHVRLDGSHRGVVLSDLLKARDRFPGRFILGYCPDPLVGDAPALLEAAYHMYRVRVCGEWKFRMLFDDPRCLELFYKAGELGCPVVLHLDVPYMVEGASARPIYQPNWYGGTVDNLERALRACPETTFIGHAPGFWRHISGDADDSPDAYPSGVISEGGRLYALFDLNPNLHADLSAGSALRALKRNPEHACTFLERFADRLLFGRDYYGGELIHFLQSLNLPSSVREKIYYKNARMLVQPVALAESTAPRLTLG